MVPAPALAPHGPREQPDPHNSNCVLGTHSSLWLCYATLRCARHLLSLWDAPWAPRPLRLQTGSVFSTAPRPHCSCSVPILCPTPKSNQIPTLTFKRVVPTPLPWATFGAGTVMAHRQATAGPAAALHSLPTAPLSIDLGPGPAKLSTRLQPLAPQFLCSPQAQCKPSDGYKHHNTGSSPTCTRPLGYPGGHPTPNHRGLPGPRQNSAPLVISERCHPLAPPSLRQAWAGRLRPSIQLGL